MKFIYKLNFYIINLYINIYNLFNNSYNNSLLYMKNKVFEEKIISYGFYDINKKKYKWIYDYDKVYLIIWLYTKYLLNIKNHLLNLDTSLDFKENIIFITSHIYKNKQYYTIFNKEIYRDYYNYLGEYKINFIYSCLDDNYDLTQEFNKFKKSILLNKYLKNKDIILTISNFSYKKTKLNENSILKLMTDNDYIEKQYNNNDILIIKK